MESNFLQALVHGYSNIFDWKELTSVFACDDPDTMLILTFQ